MYEILKTNDLASYYKYNVKPGIKPETQGVSKYEFLDSPAIASELFEFSEGDIRRVRLFLPEIHCSSCIWLLEHLYKIHEGVLNSEVHFVKKECYISFNISKLSFRELAILLDKIGYPPKFGKKDIDSAGLDTKFYLQLAVAGFAFGNIMLMSFPEYVSVDDSFAKEFRPVFSYLILFISIPVLIYSLRDYLISGYKAVRSMTVNLDVPISIGIFSLYGRSLYDIVTGNGAGYMDSFAGFAFFLLVGRWFQNRSYQSLSFERDYKSYFPMAIIRIKKEKEEMVPIEEIVEGDILRIRNEEIIPTDAVILSGNAHIDYSFVTGESKPISKKSGDQVFAGGKQLGDTLILQAQKPVEQSYLTRLWNQKIFHKKVNDSLKEWTDKLSRYFIAGVITVAILSGLVWFFIDSSQVVNVITSVLIVACPCALVLAIPFAFGNAMRVAGRHKIYIKNTSVIEQLSKVTDLVFDKTGTITYNHKVEVQYEGQYVEESDIFYAMVRNSMHPVSVALTQYFSSQHPQETSLDTFEEFPGLGIQARAKGSNYKIGSSAWVGEAQNDSMETRSYIQKDAQVLGYFKLKNKYREGFRKAQEQLRENYKSHLITGDNAGERDALSEYFPDTSLLHFNQKPLDKLHYVEQLRAQGKTVMMLGDGLNDAGALKASDVGVVVADNIYNFSPASDIIFSASALDKLPQLLKLSKYSVRVLKWSYLFSLGYNLIGLLFAVSNQLTPLVAAILMPLSSISVVFLTTASLHFYEKRFWSS